MKKYTHEKFTQEIFNQPPSWYRGVPFWSWNCKVDSHKIQRDAKVFKEMGFGGADIHCRYGLQNEYLSDEFMNLVKMANEELTKNGLLSWLYDEDRWPSGGAGGLIARPENASRCLLFTPEKRKQGFFNTAQEFYDEQKKGDPDGYFLAKYEVLLKDGVLIQYERCDERESTAFGGDFWYAYLALERNDIWYSSFGYVDTLNPRVIQEFRDVTYNRYEKTLGDEFGKSVPTMFTDEPQFAYKETLALPTDKKDIHLSYTDDMDQTFTMAYGESLLDKVPELIWELSNDAVSVTRYQYHDHVADRFYTSFFKQLYDWCDTRNIQLTGHAVEESTLWSQTRAIGEAMRCYKGLHIPGVDILCDAREYSTVKQAQSVSRQEGRDGVMSELYGVMNWDFTMRGHKVQGDWQAAMGITHRVLSLSLMSLEGGAKRDFPASLSYQLPWYKEYNSLETYFARVNTAMLTGKSVVRVGVIHPIESYWLHWGPMQQTASVRDEMEERFKTLIEWLSFGLLDFDFISESLLPQQHDSAKDGFNIGEMNYDIILVPKCETMRDTTLTALEAFNEKGGNVIFLEDAPSLLNAKPSKFPSNFAKKCKIIPFSKAAVLKALEPVREIDCIIPSSGRRAENMLYQLRKESDGKKFLFICDVTQNEKPNFFEISDDCLTKKICEISINGIYSVKDLNAMTGTIQAVPVVHINGHTIINAEFYAAQSALYELTPSSVAIEKSISKIEFIRREICELKPDGFELSEANVVLLDMPRYSINGGDMRDNEEILRIQEKLNIELNYNRGWAQPWSDKTPDLRNDVIKMEFIINCLVDEMPVILGLERPEYISVELNGKAIISKCDGWYVDEAIETMPLGTLKNGENILVITQKIGPKSYLEPFYIIGDFGANCIGKNISITSKPKKLGFADIGSQGLPFYSGSITYRSILNIEQSGSYSIAVHDFSAPLLGISLNGKRVGTIFASPYEVDLGELSIGAHEITIAVFGNRYNTFGPLHNSNTAYDWWGDCAWRTQGAYFAYEYHFKSVGIFTAPRIYKIDKKQKES